MKTPWRKPRALVGSAAKITNSQETQYVKRLQQPWQDRALGFYNTIGEIRFCAQFYARMLSKCHFYPGRMNAQGKVDRIEDGPPVDLLNRIQDAGGGRAKIQYNYGRLMFVTGEGYLLVTNPESEGERWRFVWREEVQIQDNGTAIRKDANGKLTDEKGTAYRMWTPSPIYSDLADAPLQACLDIAEELLILTAAVRSTAVTRMLNGMLTLPTEASPAPFEDGEDEDPDISPFLQRLTEHITAQIENPGSAEAKAPFLLEAGYEYLDRVKWIEMHNPDSDYMERDLRIECIKRLALGLDLPPEALLGMTDSNHWTAQQVQHDMWRSHGVPIADQFATDVNDAYLRPALRDDEYDGWEDIVIGYDDSQVVVSPDMTAIADEAMDRAAISFEGYRQLKGIPEDLAPSEEEQAFVFGLKTRDAVVAGLEQNAPSVRGPQAQPDVHADQPGTPPAPTNGRVVSRQEARVASSIMGAAYLALRQCRAKAGARLRTAVTSPGRSVQRCSECEQAIDGLPNAVVASALGADVLETMAQRDPLTLVKGGTDDFRACVEEWGVGKSEADVLCERIESYAAATLFEPNTPDLPPGFASYVEASLEAAIT